MNMKDGTMAMPGEMPAKKQTMDSMDMSRNRGTGMSTASSPVKHGPDRHGKGNTMVAEFPSNRLSEPGDGLENNGRRVLVYTDLRSLSPYPDQGVVSWNRRNFRHPISKSATSASRGQFTKRKLKHAKPPQMSLAA